MQQPQRGANERGLILVNRNQDVDLLLQRLQDNAMIGGHGGQLINNMKCQPNNSMNWQPSNQRFMCYSKF